MPDTPADTARRFIEALARSDVDAARAESAPDVTLAFPTAPRGTKRRVTGHEELAELLGMIARTWLTVTLSRLEIHPLADDPTKLLGEYEVDATNLDRSGYHNEYVGVITVVDGKVTGLREYFDPGPTTVAFNAVRAHLGLEAAR